MQYRYRCLGRNPRGVVKVFGWGDTRAMAFAQAESAARQYIRDYDLRSAPLTDWDFQVEDRLREYQMDRRSCNYMHGSRHRDDFRD